MRGYVSGALCTGDSSEEVCAKSFARPAGLVGPICGLLVASAALVGFRTEGRFVDRSGAVIESQSAPGFCIDHAAVRKEVTRFDALSRAANLSPALYGWDVWSEPHVVNWAEFPSLTNPEFCYCDSSQARFRVWLKAKYKTLGALNAAWYRNITLPQALRVNPTVVLRHAFDWAGFYAFGRTQLQQGILDRRIASWPGRHGNAHCGSRGAPRGRILDVGGRGARGA